MFFAIVGSIFLAGFWAWWWLDRRAKPGGWKVRAVVSIWMGLQLAALLAMMLFRGWFMLPTWVMVPTFTWHLLMVPFIMGLAVLWLVYSLVSPDKKPVPATEAGSDDAPAGTELSAAEAAPEAGLVPALAERSGLSRRQVLSVAVAMAPIVLTAGSAGYSGWQMRTFRVRRLEVPLADLPPALDGLRIAHVTDVHVGRFTRGKVLRRMTEITNDLKPDLIAFTGDLINHEIVDLDAGIDTLEKMKARYGSVAVEGNHDLFADAPEFERAMRASPHMTALFNESTSFAIRGHTVQFLGARWGQRNRPRGLELPGNVTQTLALRDRSAFPILLAHHPHAWDYLGAVDIPLTLAGHTHGGQLMLTSSIGAGPAMFRYWSGVYRRDNQALVVSNGAGNWFPLRVNAPAEILDITLRKA